MTTFKIESGVQLISRLAKKPQIQHFYQELFPCGPKHGDVIEVFSENNTNYLTNDIICEALLSNYLRKEEVAILYFNCCGNFNYEKFLCTMKEKMVIYLQKKNENITNMNLLNSIYNRMLSNFFLVQIYNATQLYITIHNLESILVEHPNIMFLILDNITAFYWSEQNVKITKMDVYIKSILQLIQKVTKEYQTIIIYTRPSYFCSSKDAIENLEPCSEFPSLEKLTYRIQIEHTKNNLFQVKIRTFKEIVKKNISIEENFIKWV